MNEISALRKEVKKYVDKADDKTLEIVYRILEASDEMNDPLVNMSKEQKESLRRSLEQADKGQTIPHAEVMKKYSKWFNP
jgi:predicted transcriptional regulator